MYSNSYRMCSQAGPNENTVPLTRPTVPLLIKGLFRKLHPTFVTWTTTVDMFHGIFGMILEYVLCDNHPWSCGQLEDWRKCASGRGIAAECLLSRTSQKAQLRVPLSPCKQHAPVLEAISALHTALYILLAWANGNSLLPLRKMSHYKQELVCLCIGILGSLLETQIQVTHFAFNLFFQR